MRKIMFVLPFFLIGFLKVAQAHTCAASLFTEKGVFLKKLIGEQGCEEISQQCLNYGKKHKINGYCDDEGGITVDVFDIKDNWCQIHLYVNSEFKETFARGTCRQARFACGNAARIDFSEAYLKGETRCLRGH